MINRSVRVNSMFRRTPTVRHISRYSRNVKNDANYKCVSFIIIQDGSYVEQRFLNKAFNLDNLKRFFNHIINVQKIHNESIKIPRLNRISGAYDD